MFRFGGLKHTRSARAKGAVYFDGEERPMSGSVNKVILIGNLGRDPETRTFQNGGKVCNLRIATSETWKDKASGEQKERTEWSQVAIFNEHLVKVAEQYLRKGSKVYIEGQLQTRKWQDQSGADRYSTEVVLQGFHGNLTLLDSKPEGDNPTKYRESDPPQKAELDDEIPF